MLLPTTIKLKNGYYKLSELGTSAPAASNLIHKILPIARKELSGFIRWPERDSYQENHVVGCVDGSIFQRTRSSPQAIYYSGFPILCNKKIF